jgi:hypothetical protein
MIRRNQSDREGELFARAFSASSRTMKRIRPLNHMIIGHNEIPAGLHYIGQVADQYPGGVPIKGDPTAVKLPVPRLYDKIAAIAADAVEMQSFRAMYPPVKPDATPPYRHAIALTFGKAVLLGTLWPKVPLETTIEPGQELIGVPVGPRDFTVQVGVYSTRTDTFHPAESVHLYKVYDRSSVPAEMPVA